MSNTPPLRAGILGAGYISDFHAKAITRQKQSQLVAICDLNKVAAKKLADNYPSVSVYDDLDLMLQESNLQVVHVLTQPDSHFILAKKIIEAGCHAVIEKPVTRNAEEALALQALAKEYKVSVAVNHNFVFSRPFNCLRAMVDNGELGPIKSVRIVWKKLLPQINVGPWNLWMLREPGNILFETGSHSISELLAIIDKPKITSVKTRLAKTLANGASFYRRWNISAEAGPISIQIDTSFDQGYEQHFIEVEGLFGIAKADIENDVFTVDQPTGRAYDLERLHVNLRNGLSRTKQALRTYGSYALSKFMARASGAPYETSMLNGIANCYQELEGKAPRNESSIEYAIRIAQIAESIQKKMPKTKESRALNPTPATVSEPSLEAKVLIVGASGFIGKRLLVALQNKGLAIRALVRNPSSLVGTEIKDHCEIMVGDFRNQEITEKALQGIDVVYHLAVAHGNSLEGYIKADLEPTKHFIEQCQAHKIKRFIYTGTIDSLYLGPGAGYITESDGIDKEIARRNNYAHSKSLAETYLNTLHQNEQFPVVIIRPAIVLGAGGPITHVGVANWSGLGHCAYWGQGDHALPLVLVEDIVSGLIAAMEKQGIEGNTYNLSAESCISAQEYVTETENVLGSKINAAPSSFWGYYLGDMIKWLVKVLARHPDAKRVPSIRDWRCREQHASFNTTKAQQELHWQATNDRETIIEKGIREPARLFLDN